MYRASDLRDQQDHLGDWQADVVFADNPWWYSDQKKIRKDGAGPTKGIGACHHYDQMRTAELCKLPVQDMFGERCHLYLWATAPLLPDGLDVLRAWGFRWSTIAFVWGKTNARRWEDAQARIWQSPLLPTDDSAVVRAFMAELMFFGPGFHTGSNCEIVMQGLKGRPHRHAKKRKAAQWVFAEPYETPGTDVVYGPIEEHSRKPEEPQDRVEWMYPQCTHRLELFGRRDRVGWMVLGNENLFPKYTSTHISSGLVTAELPT